MNKVVLLCHGPSLWEDEQRLEGWTDTDLNYTGVTLARDAGTRMRDAGLRFDLAFTSSLGRAIRTQWLVLEQMGQMWLPTEKDWRLNDRHYGALQGLTMEEVRSHYGRELASKWQRQYRQPVPPLSESDPRHPRHDRRYEKLHPDTIPNGESWQSMCDRVVNFWEFAIAPWVKQHHDILLVLHEPVARALVRHLHRLYEDELAELHIPRGVPLVYEFGNQHEIISHYYLSDDEQALVKSGIHAA